MLTRVLLSLTGGAGAEAAIRQAIAIAKRHNADLTGLGIVHEDDFFPHEPMSIGGMSYARAATASRAEEARQKVRSSAKLLEDIAAAEQVRCRVLHDSRHHEEALSDHWRFHDILISAHQGLFDHGVTKEPVGLLNKLVGLGIRPTIATSREHRVVERVMVAISGSNVSAKMLKRLCQMRPWGTTPLSLLHVGKDTAVNQDLLNRSIDYVRGHGIPVEHSAVIRGPVAKTILQTAKEWSADAIAMGDSNRPLVARRLFGDTALSVVRQADRPLFLTH